MAVKSVNKKVRKSIVTATAATIFSLATAMVGTYAWFASSTSVTTTGMQVTVVASGSCDLDNVKVIKFDYDQQRIGGMDYFDYLSPEKGKVSEYEYSYREGENSFGYYGSAKRFYQWNGSSWVASDDKPLTGTKKGEVEKRSNLPVSGDVGDYYYAYADECAMYFQWNGDEWVVSEDAPAEGTSGGNLTNYSDLPSTPTTGYYYRVTYGSWNKINAMNVYDPVDKVVRNSSLRDLNCNAIYEVEFTSPSYSSLDLDLVASTFDVGALGEYDILLSDCIDIDVFTDADLRDDNQLFYLPNRGSTINDNEYDDKAYYPSYKLLDQMYAKWNGSSWVLSEEKPETGSNKGKIKKYSNLPDSELSSGDYYLISEYSEFYKWNGSSWDLTYEEPATGNDKGSVRYESLLPSTPSTGWYYHVLSNQTYVQWDNTNHQWVASEEEPGTGSNRGILDYSDELPGEPSNGDYYLVNNYNNPKYYKWNGSSWDITTDEPDSGTNKGTVGYANQLCPSTNDYYLATHNEAYAKWDETEGDWLISFNEPSGTYKTAIADESFLPNVHDDGDYYLMTNYEVNKYYKWNGSSWAASDSEPSGNDKGTISHQSLLPVTLNSGDYYEVLKKPAELTDLEKVYYKISYLASLIDEDDHSHFYNKSGSKASEITIVDGKTIDFDGDVVKFYINVNYAPSVADEYYDKISVNSYTAKYDYCFNFNFSGGVSR